MTHVARHLQILSLALGLLPGCVLCTYQVSYPLGPEPVQGLKRLFDQGGGLDVLVVHGMGPHERTYADDLAQEVGQHLDEDLVPLDTIPLSAGGMDLGELKTWSSEDLRIYAVWWSPTTSQLKLDYLEGTVSEEALPVNGFLKGHLVNDRLSDPTLYAGTYGRTMRLPVEMALAHVLCDQKGHPKRPLAMITYSLGSRMLFDSVLELAREDDDARPALADLAERTHEVYMLANQLPLLALATVKGPALASRAADDPEDGLVGFLELRSAAQERAALGRLVCVAFSDPNDLLSYPIQKGFAQGYDPTKVAFVNVEVTVAKLAWLFVVASPLKAHSGYDGERQVMNVLLDGVP